MKKTIVGLLTIVAITATLSACSKHSPTAPALETAQGKVSLAINTSGDPANNIATGKAVITKGNVTQAQTISIANHVGSITFPNIQVGTWTITVQLFDANGTEIYTGSGQAVVDKNQTTTVSILVNHNTGTLQINVALPETAHLLFWNTMGSNDEILHSVVGPNLTFFTGGFDTVGVPSYQPGVYGHGVTIGNNPTWGSVHMFVLNQLYNYISPEQGAVECWYKQMSDPVAYSHGVYRIFDGAWALRPNQQEADSGMWFFVSPDSGTNQPRLYFGVAFNGSPVTVHSVEDGQTGCNISAYNGTWIHVAAVWNRQGIAGSSDTLQFYLNGSKAAAASANNWGTLVGDKVDICGGSDTNIANQFYMDNLKIWDYSKTDYSDRFSE